MNKGQFFKILIVALWIALDLSLFRKEIRAILAMPGYFNLTPEEKKIKVDGQVYLFAENLRSLTPESSSILFIYKKDGFLRKSIYYLYPRKLKPVYGYDKLTSQDLLNIDYLAAYLPADPDAAYFFERMSPEPVFDKLYEKDGGVIYKVNRELIR